MLFLLALTSLAPRNDTLANASPAEAGCNDIHNCRTLYDIIWGCLVTVFACVWVSVHPNVPKRPVIPEPPDNSCIWVRLRWQCFYGTNAFRARLKLMLAGVLAPELIVGLALRQRAMAMRFASVLNVSITHGFFICMGGFVDNDGHPLVSWQQLIGRQIPFWAIGGTSHSLDALRRISRNAIRDKSKGDIYTKTIAFCQGLWFILQSLTRLVQRLPLAQLEVATLAFTVLNVFTWVLWWDKPLDVTEPIVIEPQYKSVDSASISGNTAQVSSPTSTIGTKFLRILGIPFRQGGDPFDPTLGYGVPTFWYAAWNDASFQMEERCLFQELLIAGLFGAIHCAAWNAAFASTIEMWLWRGAALLLAVIPLAAVALLYCDMRSSRDYPDYWLPTFIKWSLLLYVPSRLITLLIPLITLRTVEPSLYVDISWSTYIPHL
ncbi:hypothetical protein MIND_00906200 [Mycena indigotica]|uniref:Wax synthase domain-containing protein n=1 Tax=Mycena indigotica TaxID=2126181 RepID=A0A8H6SDJ4_9AGAR|nr:uncharacterized protein MIND_00906200 [Mycena indigotica]KAF7296756.1 hypothetical protein MIND_00906200 [Mycena indigotica]